MLQWLIALLLIGLFVPLCCGGDDEYGQPSWPLSWAQRPRSCSYYYTDNSIEKKWNELKLACELTNTRPGDLVVVDDAYEAKWIAGWLRSENDHNKRYWARLKRTGSHPNEEPDRMPDLGGTSAFRDNWSPGGGWEWEGTTRGLWDMAWDFGEPWQYSLYDRGLILAKGNEYEEPWDLVIQTYQDTQDDSRALCEKKAYEGCVDPPTVMITTQTAFPGPGSTSFNVTLTFSDAISNLTFDTSFNDLSDWQTVGGVGGAIKWINQTDDNVIVERIWAVQPGRVTVQVNDMAFRRTSDEQQNTPSNELSVYTSCDMAWSQGKDVGEISNLMAHDWWKCGRLCREEPNCEVFVFDAVGTRPSSCRLYDDADLSGPSSANKVRSTRTCAIKTDSTPLALSFVHKVNDTGDPVAGGTINLYYDSLVQIRMSAHIHLSEPVKRLVSSDLEIACANCSVASVILNLPIESDRPVTWPAWNDNFVVEVRLEEAPAGFTIGEVVVSLSPSNDIGDFSDNGVNSSGNITFVLKPACDLMERMNGTALVGGNLKGWFEVDNHTFDSCSTECRNVPTCAAFSFHEGAGLCTLKWGSDIAQVSEWVPTADPAYDSAVRDCECLTDCIVVTPIQMCGDGLVAGGETCDDGNTDGGDGCSETCYEETGWQCMTPGSPCTPICGDGLVKGSEQCDDGNLFSGDGCSDSCSIETGWTCSTQGSPCASVCGDGLWKGSEQCDDGNLNTGDGCTDGCIIESGWSCPTPGLLCDPVCADGLLKGSEQCDDGNLINGDGCNDACQTETGWTCPIPGSPCVATTGAPTVSPEEPTGAPPFFMDDITDDLDKLKDLDALNETEVCNAIDELLKGDQPGGPVLPPIDSVEAFGERLVRAIKVASALKSKQIDGKLPNVTEGDLKAQKRVIMRALLKDLKTVATERLTNFAGVSNSPSEALLSAVTLSTTLEAADEAESDQLDDTVSAVSTFSSLMTVTKSAIAQTDNVTPTGTVKALSGVENYLDAAAALFRQLNRTAKSTKASSRQLTDGKTAYDDLAVDIWITTAQLGDSLVSRIVQGSLELSSAGGGTSMKVATRNQTQDEAMLKMETAQQSVGASFPPSFDSSSNCGGQSAESVQLVWWSEDPFSYADEGQGPTNVTVNNTLTRSAQEGTFTVAGRQCGSNLQLRASPSGEPFRMYLPRLPAGQLRALQSAEGNRTVAVELTCGFWNDTRNQWDTQGCRVNEELSNATTLCCECVHLTSFGTLFRSVILESNIEDVLQDAGDSVKKMADITAWTQNIAGLFVAIMIAIHLVCLALSIYFDCRNPITDQILLDIWMTDPLLDRRHTARTRLQKSMSQCAGRTYHPWWCDFVLCRIFGGCYLQCRKREPTLHLQELRTLRSVRQELLQQEHARRDSFPAIHGAKAPVICNVPQTTEKKAWSGLDAPSDYQADTTQMDRKSLRSKVCAPIPSLTEVIRHAFTTHQKKVGTGDRFEATKTKRQTGLSEGSGPLPVNDPNWSVMSGTSLGEEGSEPSGGSSPARRRVSKRMDSLGEECKSEDEEVASVPRSDTRQLFTPSVAARMDARSMQIFQHVFREEKKSQMGVTLIKSGVLKDALRKRLLLELQRQQAAATIIQRHWRAILECKGRCQSKEEDEAPEVEDTPMATVFGRPRKQETIEEMPQEEVQDYRKCKHMIPAFESIPELQQEDTDSPESPVSLTSRIATFVDPQYSPTNTIDQDDENDEDLSPKLKKGQTVAVEDFMDHGPKEVKLTVDDIVREPSYGKGATTIIGETAAPRRKSVTELWGDLNKEVDLIVTRILHRVEYIEWGPTKMFRKVVRRDHPLLKLFVLNPRYTAVQRTLFFGSISLGILTICAMFFDRQRMSGSGTDSVLLSFQTEDIAWNLTLRQIAVLIWSIILAKPILILLLILFRKSVPHIRPLPTRRIDYEVPVGRSSQLSKRTNNIGFNQGKRRIAEITGRHSGHFPLTRKMAVLRVWRWKEYIGIIIALLYWFACDAFLLLFAFSERLEKFDSRPSHLIYQDFVMVASVEFLNTFILQPILQYLLLSLLLVAILRIGFCDWIVWLMPHWFDFTFSGAHSFYELTIQLQAITDTHELTRGILGFAGLNIDSIGIVQDVFSL
ncbi:unnamed protein product [Vitrella brassicaformis CCMP3155]|uniref:GPS domain-containing protein n=3 Tax=Vitrella brassicaformis TaxID=1169539 RepID=A0A0G4FW07_VITBC|nr:unnamed protein product [Vitrella brassicaformis CCMP3155]|eukprot:CEM19383.1 unnamed protein product [Vitrella brassicaformis CCMP3155]